MGDDDKDKKKAKKEVKKGVKKGVKKEVKGVKKGDKSIVHYNKAVFKTKYFQGPYKDLRIPIQQLNKKYKGIKEWVMWYATCPKCAEKLGGDITIVMARIE